MDRMVQHTLHVPLAFDETCARVERRCHHLLDRATAVAATMVSRRAVDLFPSGGHDPTWAASHPLLQESDHQASMALDWQASTPSNRLLPHLDARLVINGVIVRGPHATTAVSVLGSFDLSAGLLHRIDDLLFRRRLVDDATQAFLDAFVGGLLDHPVDLRIEKSRTTAS